ncbi:AraC family transcriptional regulator [Erysipelothrix aquatica]|uniref:AraC family transcriptional regulator n=1 Tax=Erysipelothrix aquatica TaxID=2683714 RepID=UPI00135C1B30|nr:AraC family transcriptional regulator [Erysipelothrix aquatica]
MNKKNQTVKPKLLSIEQYAYEKNWHSILHSHSFTELFYVVSGKGKFLFFDGYTVNVQSDDLIIIDSNIMHTEMSSNEDPLVYIVLGIQGMTFIPNEDEYRGYSMHNYQEYKHEVLFYLRSLLQEFKSPDAFLESVSDHLLNVLIINILRRTHLKMSIKQTKTEGKNECIFVENYINTHYKQDITLDELADLTFFNKFYLSHIFKDHSGYSPIEFLLNKRLNEAKKLLLRSNHSISDIATATGFNSATHFSAYFKKKLGMSPSAFKQQGEHHDNT